MKKYVPYNLPFPRVWWIKLPTIAIMFITIIAMIIVLITMIIMFSTSNEPEPHAANKIDSSLMEHAARETKRLIQRGLLIPIMVMGSGGPKGKI